MRSLLLVLFSSLLSFGQSTKISPDCDIPFTFTGAGTSQITGCAQNLQGVDLLAHDLPVCRLFRVDDHRSGSCGRGRDSWELVNLHGGDRIKSANFAYGSRGR